MKEGTALQKEPRKRIWEPVEIRERGVLAEVLQAGLKTQTGGDSDSLKNAGGAA